MKPVVIYTMPRSRSTAALESCKRENRFCEPFSEYNLFNVDFRSVKEPRKTELYREQLYKINNTYATCVNDLPHGHIESLISNLNNPSSASKIFGFQLVNCLPARKWFATIDNDRTHDIFVLVRDLREQMLSYLVAPKFGFFLNSSVAPYRVNIDEYEIYNLRTNLDSFLRFFPRNAKVVTFEDLPDTHFDQSLINLKRQDSLNHLEYIENLEDCERYIADLIDYFKPEWDEKIRSVSNDKS